MSNAKRTLLGLILGIVAGIALAWLDAPVAAQVADVVRPFGKLWLNALQMTVVPLVLALVVVGVNSARNAASSGRVARRAIVTFVLLLCFSAAITAVLAPPILALLPHDAALAEALGNATGAVAATTTGAPGWADWLGSIVPANAIAAAANSAMLPLVVFALFLGFALPELQASQRQLLLDFFQAVSDAMIVVVGWVLAFAPFGVFALIFAVAAHAGLATLSALGAYVVLEIGLYLLVAILMLAIAVVFGREHPGRFGKSIAPAVAVGASTQSSLATLPAMLESAARLGYHKEVSALVLPMAVSLCRISSPVQYVISACFIAWALGIPVDTMHLAAGAGLAVVVSMGAVGLPGQVTFLATNIPVTQAMGLPVGPLGVMIAVDTLPDVFATAGNVTTDLVATSVVAQRSQKDVTANPTA